MSLRNMIGRSFATEDAHDKIRAYVIELFDVIECEAEANLEKVPSHQIISRVFSVASVNHAG